MNTIAFPRYTCHKQVRAVKIQNLSADATGALVFAADSGVAPFTLPFDFIQKHAPQPGGYIVAYDDGYISYSPAPAFESGYTRL